MVHEHQDEIGRLVWAGKYEKAIRLHLEAYEKDPERECVPFASTLYSSLAMPGVDKVLLEYIEEDLYPYALRLTFHPNTREAVDKADVISTIFVWAAEQPEITNTLKGNLLLVGASLINEALKMTVVYACAPHSQPLLLLTRAKIRFMGGTQEERAAAMLDLHEAKNLVDSVPDLRQRERILRKAGILFRSHGKKRAGFDCLLMALLVPHRAVGVKVKTVAALFDYGK